MGDIVDDAAVDGLDDVIDGILEHYGKKGMKWGVRNEDKPRGKIRRGLTKANVATNAGAKVIEEGESKLIFLPQKNRNEAASATQAQMLGVAIGLNKSPQFKGKDLKKDPALREEYFQRAESAARKIYADELGIARTKAWAEFLDTSVDTTGMRIAAASNRIRHANDGQETLLVLKWVLDDLGQIVDVTVPPAYLTHMDDEDVEFAFAHYGTKGMRWGVRRAENSQKIATRMQGKADKVAAKADRNEGKLGNSMTKRAAKGAQRDADRQQKYATKLADKQGRKADKRAEKQDANWEKTIYSTSGAVAVHNAMAGEFNSRIGALNDKHPDAHLDFPDKPETKAYMNDVMALEARSYSSAVSSVHGSSPSGRKKAVYIEDENGARIEVRDSSVQHAAEDAEPDLVLLLKLEAGRIVEVNTAEEAVEHADAEAFLAHYGVKGMKWGVTAVDKGSSPTLTREKKAVRDSKDVVVTQRKAGTYVKTKGGKRQKASDDAVKAHAGRQKAKKSTTDALTNDELKAVVERLQLEQKYAQLDKKVQRRGQGFIAQLLQSPAARATAQDLAKRVADTNNT